MKFYLSILITSAALFSLTGCSTIFGDNDRVVHINSTPKGSKVTVNNAPLDDRTPTETVVTNMWAPTVIKVQRPGCPSKTVVINPEFQKIGIINILVLPGFIVDAITGDMMKIPENQRNINLNVC